MNKSYKVIYSKARDRFVAVSEITRACMGRLHSSKVASVSALVAALGAVVMAGTASAVEVVLDKVLAEDDIAVQAGSVSAGGDEVSEKVKENGTVEIDPTLSNTIKISGIGLVEVSTGHNTTGLRSSNAEVKDLGTASIAMGMGAAAAGGHALALGREAQASSTSSTAIGYRALASVSDSIAIGTDAHATTVSAIAIGSEAQAIGYGPSIAIGKATAKGNYSFAVGYGAHATGHFATAIGSVAKAEKIGSHALGYRAQATAEYAYAIGGGAIASAKNSFALGTNSIADEENTISVGRKAGAVGGLDEEEDGTGTITTRRRIVNVADGIQGSDAATFGQLQAAISGIEGSDYVSVNASDTARNEDSLPTSAKATGAHALAVGIEAKAVGEDSIAIGSGATVAEGAWGSIATGWHASVARANSLAFGDSSKATGGFASAIGSNAEAAERASAFGYGALATASHAVSIGNQTKATGIQSVALGTYAEAWKENSLALGALSVADEEKTVSVGRSADSGRGEYKRRIVNVADGTKSSDAATVGQLQAALDSSGVNYLSVNATDSKRDASTLATSAKATAKHSLALGEEAKATGWENATAIGYKASAWGPGSIAIGYQATVESLGGMSNGSIAIGSESSTLGHYSNAIGSKAKAYTWSSALGGYAEAEGYYTAAIGFHASAHGEHSVALGAYSVALEADTVSVGLDSEVTWGDSGEVYAGIKRRIVNVAEGTKATDAATVGQLQTVSLKEGEQYLTDASATDKTTGITNHELSISASDTIGADTTALATVKAVYDEVRPAVDGIYVKTAQTTAANLTALDKQVSDNSSVLGYLSVNGGTARDASSLTTSAKATGVYTLAVGHEAEAGGDWAISIGGQAKATGFTTAAVGSQTQATKTGATAIGYSAKAEGRYSTAIGSYSYAAAESAVAIGPDSIADENNTISVGRGEGVDPHYSERVTRRIVNVASGTKATDAATVGQLQTVSKKADEKYLVLTPTTDTTSGITNNEFSIIASDMIASGTTALATVKAVYDEVRPVAGSGETLSYVGADKTTGANLKALDKQVSVNAGAITDLKNATNTTISGLGDTYAKLDGTNLSVEGSAFNAGKWAEALSTGASISGAGAGSNLLVTGKAVYDEVRPVAESDETLSYVGADKTTGANLKALDKQVGTNATGIRSNADAITALKNATDTAISGLGDTYAKLDGTNLGVEGSAFNAGKWAWALGGGVIGDSTVANSNLLITGATLYGEVRPVVGNGETFHYIASGNSAALNLKALDSQLFDISEKVKDYDGKIGEVVKDYNEKITGVKNELKEVASTASSAEAKADMAQKTHTTIANSDHIKATESTNAEGGKEYTLSIVETADFTAKQTTWKDGNATSTANSSGFFSGGASAADSDAYVSGGVVSAGKSESTKITLDGNTGKATFGNTVTIDGSTGRISGLAAGDVSEGSTDAVTGAQLYEAQQGIAQNAQGLESLGRAVNKVDRKIDRTGALAAALAGLHPQDYDEDHPVSGAVGIGHYKGKQALAVGMFVRPVENFMVSLGASGSADDYMLNAGASFRFGGPTLKKSPMQMAARLSDQEVTIRDLSAQNLAQKTRLESQDAKLLRQASELEDQKAEISAQKARLESQDEKLARQASEIDQLKAMMAKIQAKLGK